MENIIVVFNNRNLSLQFATNLKKNGINCKTVDTPRELSVSCGISIILSKIYLLRVKQLLKSGVYREIPRIYHIITNGVFKKYLPI
ncbi:MAG: DUF3343 domain-containing protein [Clostridiales bacterium]|nr:DUF3343 domain-containing protein [Clostridiales bacterium]